MRLLPRSLSGRLVAISTLTTALALAFAAFGIGHVLERFVMHGLDRQLDTEIAMLARALRPDGSLDTARVVDLPMFADRGQGWGWRVESPAGRWRGGDPFAVDGPDAHGGPGRGPGSGPGPDGAGAMPGEGVTATGAAVHLRTRVVPTTAHAGTGVARIVAGGPRSAAVAPLRQAMVPLLGALAILAAALVLTTVVQLRFGLRPLRRLQAAVADVRAGRARHVPPDQPDELAPLAAELNALIDRNAAQLDSARRHVANLAHGMKTPLAALAIRLAEDGRDPDGTLGALVARIDGRVRHHLGRARAAAPGNRSRARTLLAPAVAGLAAVMRGVHRDRAVAVSVDIAADLAVAMDAQDLDELLGNLFDNGWRHAASAVRIAAAASGAAAVLTLDDDGPGLTEAQVRDALVPGRRLDERGDGHGFGLPIAQELAELNGGALAFGETTAGRGLRVTLTLPAAVSAAGAAGSAGA